MSHPAVPFVISLFCYWLSGAKAQAWVWFARNWGDLLLTPPSHTLGPNWLRSLDFDLRQESWSQKDPHQLTTHINYSLNRLSLKALNWIQFFLLTYQVKAQSPFVIHQKCNYLMNRLIKMNRMITNVNETHSSRLQRAFDVKLKQYEKIKWTNKL